MKFPIKILYDFDENEYIVFIDGIKGIEGRGESEAEALADFEWQYDVQMRDKK